MSQAAPARTLMGHYAGFFSRLLAFAADAGIMAVTLILFAWLLNLAHNTLSFSLKPVAGAEAVLGVIFSPLVLRLLALFYIIIYYVFFLAAGGQTPGKAIMGIRVVRLDGKRTSYARAALRLIGYLLSAIPLCLGYVWMMADDRRQTWHDKLAGTCVIYTWPARPDERFLAAQISQLDLPSQEDAGGDKIT